MANNKKNKAKGTTKKGPKGKRARAKAKLDRQWGERGNTAEVIVRRKGKSRLLQKEVAAAAVKKEDHHHNIKPVSAQQSDEEMEAITTFKNHDDDNNNNNNNSDDDESSARSSSSIDEDILRHSYLTLMKSIKKRNKTKLARRHDDSHSSSSDGDSDSDMGESSSEDEDEKMDDYITFGDDDDGQQDDDYGLVMVDPFTERFSREPLPEDKMDATLKELHQQTVKVANGDSSLLDVQMSKEMANKLQLVSDRTNDEKPQQQRRTIRKLLHFYREVLQRNWKGGFDKMQALVFPMLSSYMDILMTATTTTTASYRQTYKCRENIHRITALHMLNHVWTSRSRIYRHNRRIQQLENADNEIENAVHDDDVLLRDQGFTRPTVLVILPTRSCCYYFVQGMLSLLHGSSDGSGDVDNRDRFEIEYGKPPPPEDDDDAGGEGADQRRRRQTVIRQKGPAWNELFGDDRNDDDDFKIGVQVNLKKSAGGGKRRRDNKDQALDQSSCCSIKLYSDFYKSDIILASPLGLKMTMKASDGDEEQQHRANADFLSSIEICLITRADVLLMQNWDHVNDVLGLLNQQPKAMNETDFSRVRQYMLAGQAAHWRQLIVLSEISDPCILSSFKRHAKSVNGIAKIRRRYSLADAGISSVVLPTRQVFQLVPSSSFANQSEDRLKYFVDKILPQLERHKQNHTMIFIPSYFDFVSLRNVLLKRQDSTGGLDFVSITEYSRVTEVSRGRARFLQGRRPLMLYTGRAHFFLRHAIKGVRHLILFGLPEYAAFYSDLVNRLNEGLKGDDDGTSASCLTLFTKYDSHALERIVGSSNCSRMVKGEKSTFLFTA